MDVKKVPDKILEECIARGWSTNYELSKRSTVPGNTISAWYCGRHLPNLVSLSRVCDAFGLTMAEFLSEGKLKEVSPEEEKLLNSFRKLSQKKKDAMMEYLSSLDP